MFNTKNCRMHTPWGTSDYKIEYARGLFRINTPGHGGIAVSKGLASRVLSEKAIKLAGIVLGGYVFFEEDCAVCVAAVDSEFILTHMARSFNKDSKAMHAEMLDSVMRWFPSYMAKDETV